MYTYIAYIYIHNSDNIQSQYATAVDVLWNSTQGLTGQTKTFETWADSEDNPPSHVGIELGTSMFLPHILERVTWDALQRWQVKV